MNALSHGNPRFLVPTVKVLVAIGMLAAALAVPVLWVLSGDVAAEVPEFAGLRWPYLLVGVGLVVCVEVVGVALWKLLSRVAGGEIFDARGLVCVNTIVGAALTAAVLFALACVPAVFVTHGPPALTLVLMLATAASLGFGLLMLVMRQLLVQATGLRAEMDEVI